MWKNRRSSRKGLALVIVEEGRRKKEEEGGVNNYNNFLLDEVEVVISSNSYLANTLIEPNVLSISNINSTLIMTIEFTCSIGFEIKEEID